MNIRDYIEATQATLQKQEDVESVLNSLKLYLEKRGLEKFYPRILRGLIEKIRRSETNAKPKITLAREDDQKRYQQTISEALKKLELGELPETVVDKSIIGGFIVKGKDKRIDSSYKNTLLQTYHRLLD